MTLLFHSYSFMTFFLLAINWTDINSAQMQQSREALLTYRCVYAYVFLCRSTCKNTPRYVHANALQYIITCLDVKKKLLHKPKNEINLYSVLKENIV